MNPSIEKKPVVPAPITPATTVSASTLATPPQPLNVPLATPAPAPVTSPMVGAVANENQNIITAHTNEAKQLKDLQASYSALNGVGSLSDMYSSSLTQNEVPQNIKTLKDIQLQLASANTASDKQKVQIEGAGGQTVGQAQREVTQQDRENAVRTTGLAAQAAVLQGNIETATALAKQTVDLAYQDRTLKATNLINQINSIQRTVDSLTAQLLEQDKRTYEAELATVKELKDNIANAIVSGASSSEITQLNDPSLPDEQKLALAQSITARGSNQMRNLDIQSKQANISQSYASIASSNTDRLLKLAAAGDNGAIGKLGFDPRTTPEPLDATSKRTLETAVQSTDNLLQLTTKYKKIIDDHGFTNTLAGDPKRLGEISSLRGLITSEYKKAEALGTLDNGVLALVNNIIGDEPTSTFNPFRNATGRPAEQLSSQISTLIDTLNVNNAKNLHRLGIDPTSVDFSMITPEDNNAIDSMFGGATNTSTSKGFNASSYFNKK